MRTPETEGSTTYCVSYDISFLINLRDADLLTAVRGGTAFELRAMLGVMRAAGREAIVVDKCDHQSRQGLCLGHRLPESYRALG